jgi:hypothetical protein
MLTSSRAVALQWQCLRLTLVLSHSFHIRMRRIPFLRVHAWTRCRCLLSWVWATSSPPVWHSHLHGVIRGVSAKITKCRIMLILHACMR